MKFQCKFPVVVCKNHLIWFDYNQDVKNNNWILNCEGLTTGPKAFLMGDEIISNTMWTVPFLVWYLRVLHFKSFLQRLTPCVMDYYGLLWFYTSSLIFRSIFFKFPPFVSFSSPWVESPGPVMFSFPILITCSLLDALHLCLIDSASLEACQPSPHNAVCLPVCDSCSFFFSSLCVIMLFLSSVIFLMLLPLCLLSLLSPFSTERYIIVIVWTLCPPFCLHFGSTTSLVPDRK